MLASFRNNCTSRGEDDSMAFSNVKANQQNKQMQEREKGDDYTNHKKGWRDNRLKGGEVWGVDYYIIRREKKIECFN